jgi:predicted nuclease with TOPRIM domain
MQDIQELFQKLQEYKKEQRDVRKEFKYSLENDGKYMELTEELKTLREKKKQIEDSYKPAKLEEIKDEIDDLNEMISDIAMNTLMEGKSVYLKDEYEVEYEPVYKISFKKIK